MNERIFELAEQAENYAITRHPVSNIALSVNSEKFVKKLAELIVRECANHIRDSIQTMERGKLRASIAHAATLIEEHFGVK